MKKGQLNELGPNNLKDEDSENNVPKIVNFSSYAFSSIDSGSNSLLTHLIANF